MKQLKRKLHSTSNCKNIPEFSVICCHSGFSGLLKTRVKQPPCNVLFRGGRGNHQSQSLSVWLSPETCKSISFCKTPAKQRDKDADSLVAIYRLGNWAPYRNFTEFKNCKNSLKTVICTAFCNREFNCIIFKRKQNNFGVVNSPLLATNYQFQSYPHIPALQGIYIEKSQALSVQFYFKQQDKRGGRRTLQLEEWCTLRQYKASSSVSHVSTIPKEIGGM